MLHEGHRCRCFRLTQVVFPSRCSFDGHDARPVSGSCATFAPAPLFRAGHRRFSGDPASWTGLPKGPRPAAGSRPRGGAARRGEARCRRGVPEGPPGGVARRRGEARCRRGVPEGPPGGTARPPSYAGAPARPQWGLPCSTRLKTSGWHRTRPAGLCHRWIIRNELHRRVFIIFVRDPKLAGSPSACMHACLRDCVRACVSDRVLSVC